MAHLFRMKQTCFKHFKDLNALCLRSPQAQKVTSVLDKIRWSNYFLVRITLLLLHLLKSSEKLTGQAYLLQYITASFNGFRLSRCFSWNFLWPQKIFRFPKLLFSEANEMIVIVVVVVIGVITLAIFLKVKVFKLVILIGYKMINVFAIFLFFFRGDFVWIYDTLDVGPRPLSHLISVCDYLFSPFAKKQVGYLVKCRDLFGSWPEQHALCGHLRQKIYLSLRLAKAMLTYCLPCW